MEESGLPSALYRWRQPMNLDISSCRRMVSVGAYIAAGYCANILANLAEGKEVKYFPKFYLSPLLEEI